MKEKHLDSKLDTFKPHRMRMLSKNKADPSFGLGFLLNSDQDIETFRQELYF